MTIGQTRPGVGGHRRPPDGHSFQRNAQMTTAAQRVNWIFFLVLLLFGMPCGVRGESTDLFRIGFSKAAFGEVNENDAIAAIRVWAQALVLDRGIPADPQPEILHGVGEIAANLSAKSVDCLNLTTPEFAEVRELMDGEEVVAAVTGGSVFDEYVLVVHSAGGIVDLKDLQGRTLGVLDSARTSLAPAWLETLLAQAVGRPSAHFLQKISKATKINKLVLPVFFRQMDACLVTRRGFDTMVELNPQLGQQLKLLAVSPPVVPLIFGWRAGYDSRLRAQVLEELAHWHTIPAGRQILTLFQVDSLTVIPVAALDSSLELLAAYHRVLAETGAGRAAADSRRSRGDLVGGADAPGN